MDEVGTGGGSRALAEELDSHGGYILSDFREFYQVDILDLFRDDRELSPRVAIQLLMDLPIKSRYQAARRGGQEFVGWDEDRYAAVDVANSMRSLVYLYSQTHSKKKLTQPKPFPVPAEKRKKKAAEPGSFAGFVQAAKKRHDSMKEK